jgi:Zn-dependent peptidase ImmA (M78 family)
MAPRDPLFEASKKANEVIEDLSLKDRIRDGGYMRVDPAQIAATVNVQVMYKKLDKLLGGFIRERSNPGILVNCDRPRGLMHMTCAHELGHFFLDHESSADQEIYHGTSASMVERTADQFAYSLLAPRWLVAKTMNERKWTTADLVQPHVVYQMSLRLGVSFKAMVWSLNRLKLLKDPVTLALDKIQPKALKLQTLRGAELEHANADVWVLDPADKERVLEPGYGDRFVLELPNHAGSGHLWSVDDLRSEGFTLQPFTADGRQRDPVQSRNAIVGSGSATLPYVLDPPEMYRRPAEKDEDLDPIYARRREVSLQEVTPWLPASQPMDIFAFNTEFEPIREGFSVSEREKLVSASLQRKQ